jgi:hypothetical protein
MGFTVRLTLGVVLALLAAGALNLGFYAQHRAAHGLGLSLRHPVSGMWRLLCTRDWMIGYASAWVGWGLYIAALCFAPLSVVQALAAGGVGLLALLAHVFGVPLQRRERWGVGLALVGLVFLCVSLPALHHTASHDRSGQLLALLIGGSAAAGVAALVGLQRRMPAWPLALAAGLFYAVSDLATKACVNGQIMLFLPFMMGGAALAFVCLQLSFGRGPVLATAGLASLVNNALPIVGGVLVFHESVGTNAAGLARLLGFVATVVGAVLLARQPDETAPAPHDPDGPAGPALTSAPEFARTGHR